jgi:uncharacterized protein YbjT (DUF2867 family)
MRKALIAGASGLVGSELLKLLLDSEKYDKVLIIGRKPIPIIHPKATFVKVDFNTIDSFTPPFMVNDVYCALGTTIKQAGSQEAFRKVDMDYVVGLGKYCEKQKAERFLVISAMGADANSRIFYNKVKGEMETAIQQLNIPAVFIFRPSLLMGKREEFRFGERFAQVMMGALGFLFMGSFKKYKPIKALTVAKSMVRAAFEQTGNRYTYNSGELQVLGSSKM